MAVWIRRFLRPARAVTEERHGVTEFGKTLRANHAVFQGWWCGTCPFTATTAGGSRRTGSARRWWPPGCPTSGRCRTTSRSTNAAGTTRGIHAEPWDKFVSVATGRIFGAWVDLRDGPTFGTVFTAELDPSRAVFVPRGVGNAFQTLEPNTAYIYLVNDH